MQSLLLKKKCSTKDAYDTWQKLNAKRLFNSAYKSTEKSELRRRVIRRKAKQKDDKTSEVEGSSYEAGAF